MKRIMTIFIVVFSLSLIATAKSDDLRGYQKLGQGVEGYRVLLLTAAEGEGIPAGTVLALTEVGEVKPSKNADGTIAFYSKIFETKSDCKAAMEEYEKLGFTDMAIVEVKGE